MRAKVTEQGLIIPRNLLEGLDEVEIRKEAYGLIVVPAGKEDPILQFGRQPIDCDVEDASVKLDRYLY